MISIIKEIKRKCIELGQEKESIKAIILVGSYARNEQKNDSDIDVMIITDKKSEIVEKIDWVKKYGEVISKSKEEWGVVTSWRILYKDYEIEFNIGDLSWINIPLDIGTEKALADGYIVLYDKSNYLTGIRSIIKERNLV